MPVLSEVGADRKDGVNRINRYIREFEMVGADTISKIPAMNRNVKLNLVTEAFFLGDKPNHSFSDPTYGQIDQSSQPTLERVLDILKIPESREIFGLTFRDLIDMDTLSLDKIEKKVLDLYKKRSEMQEKEEAKHEK